MALEPPFSSPGPDPTILQAPATPLQVQAPSVTDTTPTHSPTALGFVMQTMEHTLESPTQPRAPDRQGRNAHRSVAVKYLRVELNHTTILRHCPSKGRWLTFLTTLSKATSKRAQLPSYWPGGKNVIYEGTPHGKVELACLNSAPLARYARYERLLRSLYLIVLARCARYKRSLRSLYLIILVTMLAISVHCTQFI